MSFTRSSEIQYYCFFLHFNFTLIFDTYNTTLRGNQDFYTSTESPENYSRNSKVATNPPVKVTAHVSVRKPLPTVQIKFLGGQERPSGATGRRDRPVISIPKMETRTEIGLLSPFSPMFSFAKRNADIHDSKVKDEFSESSLSSIDSEIFSTPENINTDNIIWTQKLCSGRIHQGAQPIPLRLADHLLLMIKEWHDAYPKNIPPAALRVSEVSQDWRVFETNGEKASMSVLEFSSPLRYKMLVLHVPNSADRFVAVVHREGNISFYKAWLYGNTYDSEICAVRVHNGYSKSLLASGFFGESLSLAREKLPTRKASSSAAALPKELIEANTAPLPVRMGSEETHHVLQRDRTTRDSAANAFDSDHTSAKPRRSTRTKKGVKMVVNKPCGTTDESCFPIGKVIMKLVAQNPEITRCFPLDVCRSSDELFERATTFFRLLNKKVHVDVLSCLIAAGAERRYLFKGADEEFTIFVEDVKDLANRSTETHD